MPIVQPPSGSSSDPLLSAIAALEMVADRYIYGTGADTVALGTVTAAGRAILDDADASAQRTTLGLGALATAASVASALGYTPENAANRAIANGYAPLDATAKVATTYLPDAVLGAVSYQGSWNASTNSPAIPAAASSNKGHYYVVSVAGSTSLSGITDWALGDWAISNGTAWQKIDNTDAVISVAGLTGTISAASLRTALSLVIGTDVQAYDGDIAAIAALTSAADRLPYFTGSGTASLATFTAAGRALVDDASASDQRTTLGLGSLATASTITVSQISDPTNLKPTESMIIAVGDETTAITTGNAKVTWRMPYAFTLTAVRASLNTASTSGIPTVDINEGGTTILSTKLTIDANEKTSTTAATPPVMSDTSLADDAEMTIDIDVAGTGAKGLKVVLIGTRT